MGDVFDSDEFQSNSVAGDAAPIEKKMEACEDLIGTKQCKKVKKGGKCGNFGFFCKKTCDLCQDECLDTLGSLHCLSEG